MEPEHVQWSCEWDHLLYAYLKAELWTGEHLPLQPIPPWRSHLVPSLPQRRTGKSQSTIQWLLSWRTLMDNQYKWKYCVHKDYQISVYKKYLCYQPTFSLSFSLHHLSFLVKECPNSFTYKRKIYIKYFLIVSLLSYLFCAESDKIGSLGSKWNLPPQLELTVLAVDLKKRRCWLNTLSITFKKQKIRFLYFLTHYLEFKIPLSSCPPSHPLVDFSLALFANIPASLWRKRPGKSLWWGLHASEFHRL